ncbi:alcohol dehydrogenase catalytic domain-containing protein [Aestuariirhabdus sp. Z084]|uniref:alcohol dehydrogenase catalytic domain-containing protein n=1 Tax=Aestuariirhabdus haliotis TaxID=2918751 RepID=UPI00201B3A1F|nr:alcohol dehydrogenase catalytic domain-containing protein [Aestuariirhabdus haliotis]MCL6417691.1 alcohol dehydrogenase catalytic domain-containing protein [Aestuariirhabdus haliotis]MCL6421630.1 alcohol dehydrogenase catalytic domain-containing protein [Aestuariirhabdus haliotis]
MVDSIPTVMSAVVLTGHGDFDQLDYQTHVPVPVPGNDEVLIKVSAAGVNNTDINTRIGWYSKSNNSSEDAGWSGQALPLPLIQGADVCGEIVAVGAQVNKNRLGQRVIVEPCFRDTDTQPSQMRYLGSECNGGFAQYTCVPAQHAYNVSCDLTDIELASFPCSYSTAENMLTKARVGTEDKVLITGASGGVGSAAVQLAKARGAEVIAITSTGKSDQLLALGARQTLSRSADLVQSLGANSVDVVIDLVAALNGPSCSMF